MYTGMFHTHKLAVTIFLLIYIVKLVLILMNRDKLDKFSKVVKVPEMIISFLFLATGIYLAINAAEISTMQWIKFALVLASIPLAIIGFKKGKKMLAILGVLFIIGAYGLAEMNKGRKVKPVAINPNIETNTKRDSYDIAIHGKALYLSQCALCHGDNGKKQLSGAKDLTISEKSKEEMFEIINNGKNTMPAYGDMYNKEEIDAMIAYIKTLKVFQP